MSNSSEGATFESFGRLVDAYVAAEVWTHLPGSDRLESAERYRHEVSLLSLEPQTSVALAARELQGEDEDRANAAARYLVELADENAVAVALDAYSHPGRSWLDPAHLAYVKPDQKDIRGRVEALASSRDGSLRAPALRALLRRSSADARERLANELHGEDEWLAPMLVRTAADWLEDDWLAAHSAAELSDAARLACLTELAARGRTEAVETLRTLATARDGQAAAGPCLALADLGHRAGLEPVEALFDDTDAEAADLARTAAQYLRAAALGPKLLQLLRRPELARDAASTLFELTGAPFDEDFDVDDRLTKDAVHSAAETQTHALAALDPDRRYRHGKLLTPSMLADLLLSPHFGTTRASWYGLRAATGEQHGFVPDDDLIANADSVRAWQERTASLDLLVPGGWWYALDSVDDRRGGGNHWQQHV